MSPIGVGGEAAKQRNIEGAWRNYNHFKVRIETGRALMEEAEAGYRAAAVELGDAPSGIFEKGEDPILDQGES